MRQTGRHQLIYRALVAISALSALLFVLTLFQPQWIEILFDETPDDGDGSFERWIVGGGFLIASVLAAFLARRQRAAETPGITKQT
jgi:hypothetical protein